MRRSILLSEIGRQCHYALMAYGDAADAMARRDPDRFWYSLEAVVSSASRVRQFLWDEPDLRAALGVTEDSVLNVMPDWRALHGNRVLDASNFGPEGFTTAQPGECVRFFDLPTSIFICLGNVFELAPLLTALAEVAHRAETECSALK